MCYFLQGFLGGKWRNLKFDVGVLHKSGNLFFCVQKPCVFQPGRWRPGDMLSRRPISSTFYSAAQNQPHPLPWMGTSAPNAQAHSSSCSNFRLGGMWLASWACERKTSHKQTLVTVPAQSHPSPVGSRQISWEKFIPSVTQEVQETRGLRQTLMMVCRWFIREKLRTFEWFGEATPPLSLEWMKSISHSLLLRTSGGHEGSQLCTRGG